MKDTISQMELSLTNCKLLVEQLLMTNSQILLNNERELNKVKIMKLQIDEILRGINSNKF
ncbi:hypothetical protein [Sedimentibacter sp. B4]|uniref:hypothetical protein n=1 Tax=Sedimentibacter sp. B4 TaxID=304766 RepID=UPI0002E81808|nr:hypothetical protein [Sedimentibacter sp. B4]